MRSSKYRRMANPNCRQYCWNYNSELRVNHILLSNNLITTNFLVRPWIKNPGLPVGAAEGEARLFLMRQKYVLKILSLFPGGGWEYHEIPNIDVQVCCHHHQHHHHHHHDQRHHVHLCAGRTSLCHQLPLRCLVNAKLVI